MVLDSLTSNTMWVWIVSPALQCTTLHCTFYILGMGPLLFFLYWYHEPRPPPHL